MNQVTELTLTDIAAGEGPGATVLSEDEYPTEAAWQDAIAQTLIGLDILFEVGLPGCEEDADRTAMRGGHTTAAMVNKMGDATRVTVIDDAGRTWNLLGPDLCRTLVRL